MSPELLDTSLVGLVDRQVFLPVSLLLAVVLGAGHACAPGHGKTLAAAYLVGGRARPRDALLLGLAVAAMHTVSVVLLGVGWYALAGTAPDLAVLTRWLQLVAAVVVVAVGIVLLRRHLLSRGRRPTTDRLPAAAIGTSEHGHHEDDVQHLGSYAHGQHEHDTDEHARLHAAQASSLLTRRGLLTLGASGGLLPSPAAFLVLLTGLFTGEALSAALLVAAFGLGMALTLGCLGWLVLHGRDHLLRHAADPRLQRWATRLPLLSAAGVVTGGTVLVGVAAARLVTL